MNENGGEVPTDDDGWANGHGGRRIPGAFRLSVSDHDGFVSAKRATANLFFCFEKDHYADFTPNPSGKQKGTYQIDSIFKEEYHSMYVMHCTDILKVQDSDIAGYDTWMSVWQEGHMDLVMRKWKDVDSKDKVACSQFMFVV